MLIIFATSEHLQEISRRHLFQHIFKRISAQLDFIPLVYRCVMKAVTAQHRLVIDLYRRLYYDAPDITHICIVCLISAFCAVTKVTQAVYAVFVHSFTLLCDI